MKLGELLQQYMSAQRLSYREFSKKCNLSAGYISMLVNDRNPKTGKPPVPAITTYNAIAKGMGLTLDELFDRIDDAPVSLQSRQSPDDLWSEREALRDDPDRRALLDLAYNGSADDVRQVAAIIDALRKTNPDFYDGDDPA